MNGLISSWFFTLGGSYRKERPHSTYLVDPLVWSRDFKAAVFLGVFPQRVVHLDVVAFDAEAAFLLLV